MRSIQDLLVKIKSEKRFLLLIIVTTVGCILIGLFSFILGRLSVKTDLGGPNIIHIEYPPLVAQYEAQTGERGVKTGQYVASINGKKYYTLDCGGVLRIKEENRIFFSSVTEVENAGYEPAANCF